MSVVLGLITVVKMLHALILLEVMSVAVIQDSLEME